MRQEDLIDILRCGHEMTVPDIIAEYRRRGGCTANNLCPNTTRQLKVLKKYGITETCGFVMCPGNKHPMNVWRLCE